MKNYILYPMLFFNYFWLFVNKPEISCKDFACFCGRVDNADYMDPSESNGNEGICGTGTGVQVWVQH